MRVLLAALLAALLLAGCASAGAVLRERRPVALSERGRRSG
ncbi:MAG TPA: hypothetical protein VME19_04865 [Streptosporangiaceae bacterium]|jgi:outer membrane murein-binding lipoprotein Lpp|nr:hypothetical protein [Streptosporangiaceae bacterium]